MTGERTEEAGSGMTSGATASAARGGRGRHATAGADMWARGVGGRRRERWAEGGSGRAEVGELAGLGREREKGTSGPRGERGKEELGWVGCWAGFGFWVSFSFLIPFLYSFSYFKPN